MAKSRNQKGKILVLEHLLMKTSESQIVTMQEILDKLIEYGITAERKSIYDDIEALREFGLDVQYKRGRPGGYYLVNGSTEAESVTTECAEEKEKVSENCEDTQNVLNEEKKTVPVVINVENILCKDEIQDTEKTIKLQCSGARQKEIRDYFGGYGEYKLKESGSLQVTIPMVAGPKFYGWLTTMGKDVHILKPKKAAVSYRDYLKGIAKEYKGI